jgi:hypothetical protein
MVPQDIQAELMSILGPFLWGRKRDD